MAKTWRGIGHTAFGMTASLNFRVGFANDSEKHLVERVTTAFKNAWMQLRLNFPTIAAEVVYDTTRKKCKRVYNVPENTASVEDWLNETFTVLKKTISGRELAKADKPIGRFAILFLLSAAFITKQSSKVSFKEMSLLFKCGHDIVDGVGTLKLLNSLFDFAVAAFKSGSELEIVQYGSEVKNLSPPLAIAYGLQEPPTEQQLSEFNAMQAQNKKNRKDFEVIGFPTKITTAVPQRSQLAEMKLSTQESTRTLELCKSFGITATYLFHAASALALGSVQDRKDYERKVRYITYALMNLRGICNTSSVIDLHPDSVLHTVSVNHLVVDLTIPAESDEANRPSRDELLNTLYCVRDFYRGNVVDTNFIATIMTLFKAVTPPYPENVTAIPAPSKDCAVSFSSLGLIDKLLAPKHEAFTVSDVSISAGECSTGVGLFFGTFNGEMKVEASYNEAFHDENAIMTFLQKVKEFVMDILEVVEAGNE